MYKMDWRSMQCNWTVCCVIVVYFLCASVAFPPMSVEEKEQQLLSPPPSVPSFNKTAPIDHAQQRGPIGIGQPRQAAFLATLGAAAAPFFASLISPLLATLATTVSSLILGKLQGAGSELNLTTGEPLHYEAYMINVPNETGPYLLLTNAANSDSRRPIVSTATSVHSHSPLNRRPVPHPQPGLKVTQHLGTVNVKPYAPFKSVPTDNSAYPDENPREELEDS